MYNLLMSFSVLSLFASVYFLVGVLIPRLPFARTRGRAAMFVGLCFVGCIGLVSAADASLSPEQRQETARLESLEKEQAVAKAAQEAESAAKQATAAAAMEAIAATAKYAPPSAAARSACLQLASVIDELDKEIMTTIGFKMAVSGIYEAGKTAPESTIQSASLNLKQQATKLDTFNPGLTGWYRVRQGVKEMRQACGPWAAVK